MRDLTNSPHGLGACLLRSRRALQSGSSRAEGTANPPGSRLPLKQGDYIYSPVACQRGTLPPLPLLVRVYLDPFLPQGSGGHSLTPHHKACMTTIMYLMNPTTGTPLLKYGLPHPSGPGHSRRLPGPLAIRLGDVLSRLRQHPALPFPDRLARIFAGSAGAAVRHDLSRRAGYRQPAGHLRAEGDGLAILYQGYKLGPGPAQTIIPAKPACQAGTDKKWTSLARCTRLGTTEIKGIAGVSQRSPPTILRCV